jgi:hypothetical protein
VQFGQGFVCSVYREEVTIGRFIVDGAWAEVEAIRDFAACDGDDAGCVGGLPRVKDTVIG